MISVKLLKNRLSFYIVICLLTICVNLPAKGIGYHFIQYNSNKGLSQNTIYSIVKDDKGFMWFGTFDGLNRFDGYDFKKYYPKVDSENSLTSNDITYLHIDKKRRFWISAFGSGLNQYIPEQEQFLSYKNDVTDSNSIQSDYIFSITEDKESNLWLTTLNEGIIKFEPEQNKFTNFRPQDKIPTLSNHVRSLFLNDDGSIWFGSTKGVGILNPETGEVKKIIDKTNLLSDLFILSICQTDDGAIWIGDNKGSLYKYNINSNLAQKYEVKYNNGKMLNSSISEFYEDNDKILWIGTRAGLFYYDNNKDQILSASNKLTSSEISFDYKRIESLYQSDDGVFWVGTHSEGVFKVINIQGKFNHHILPKENENEFDSRTVKAIFRDSKNNIWFGKETGVIKFNFQTKTYSFFKYNPEDKNTISFDLVSDICEDDEENIWIATSRGLNEFNPKTEKIRRYLLDNKYENTRRIRKLVFSKNKKLYIGTSGQGVLIMKNKRIVEHLMHKESNINTLSGNLISTIFEDSNGLIWIGTFGDGLNKYNPKTKQIKRYNFDKTNKGFFDKIYSIWEDKRQDVNILWIATSSGLVKLNRVDDTFKYYTMKDGLPNNILYAVLGDDDNNLWISSNAGISKFYIPTERFVNYDVNSGLQGMEFNFNAYLKDKNGMFYFGGVNGYNVFHPDSIFNINKCKSLIFTKLIIDNIEVSSEEKTRINKSFSYADQVNLNWRDNVVKFEFSSMDYSTFNGSNYAYKMEGLDDRWNFIGLNRTATYTNIPSGTYELKISTVDVEGEVSENFSSITVNVKPPFWNTWLARIIYILAAILGLYGLIKFYLSKQQKELNKEKELTERLVKVDKLKAEFLAQMSHEIRTPVNTMLNFTSLIREELSDKINDDLRVSFEVIDKGGRRLVRTIDLILNVSELQLGTYNPKIENVDVVSEIIKPLFKEFYSHAESKKLDLKFTNEIGEDVFLDIDKYSITQIFINLIDNAIKYTDEGKIELRIFKNEEQQFCVDVIDTGIGISDEYIAKLYEPFSQEETGYTRRYEGTGLGLSLVKKCCDINKIKIKVVSNKNVGSTFTLVFTT